MRLQRKGRKKRPFYHIVVADSRSPRDGKFIERLGSYNPMTKPATIEIDRDKAYDWLVKGAQPTDTVRAILRFKGVYYRKHLMRGVKKGALTVEEAEAKYQEWVAAKEAKIAERVAKSQEEKAAFHAAVSGTPPPKPEPETEEIESVEIPEAQGEAEIAAEETPAEEQPAEETPTAEAQPAEEAPAAEEEKPEEEKKED